MKLAELVQGVDGATVRGDPATEISGLAYHTRDVADGTLFFCVPGLSFDGHDFAAAPSSRAPPRWSASAHGAAAVEVQVPSVRRAMALMGARWYGEPSRGLTVGRHRHQRQDHDGAPRGRHPHRGRPADGAARHGGQPLSAAWTTPVKLTTAESLDLQRMFREMVARGDAAVRARGQLARPRAGPRPSASTSTRCSSATSRATTSTTTDLEDYFLAKRRLFLPDEVRNGSAAVVNVGDEYGRRWPASAGRCTATTCGPVASPTGRRRGRSCGGRARPGPALRADASDFTLVVPGLDLEERVTLRLAARFNVENALAAATAGLALGLPPEAVLRGLAVSEGVPGRFQAVRAGQPFAVVVDYSHTPDSLENALRAARSVTRGRPARGRLRRRPRPRQAALMGEIGAGSPTSPSSRRTTRAARSRWPSSTRSSPACRRSVADLVTWSRTKARHPPGPGRGPRRRLRR